MTEVQPAGAWGQTHSRAHDQCRRMCMAGHAPSLVLKICVSRAPSRCSPRDVVSLCRSPSPLYCFHDRVGRHESSWTHSPSHTSSHLLARTTRLPLRLVIYIFTFPATGDDDDEEEAEVQPSRLLTAACSNWKRPHIGNTVRCFDTLSVVPLGGWKCDLASEVSARIDSRASQDVSQFLSCRIECMIRTVLLTHSL